MTNLPQRLRDQAHLESAAVAPQVSRGGEFMKKAADEIERLEKRLSEVAKVPYGY